MRRGLEARLFIFPAFLGGVTIETRETPRGGSRAAVALRAQRSERQITQLRRSSLPPSLLLPSLPAGSIPPSLPPSAAAPMEAGAGDGGRGVVVGVPALLRAPPRLPPALSFPLQVAEPGAAAPESRGPRAGEQGGGTGGPIWGGLRTGGAACAGGVEGPRGGAREGQSTRPAAQPMAHTGRTSCVLQPCTACSSPALHTPALCPQSSNAGTDALLHALGPCSGNCMNCGHWPCSAPPPHVADPPRCIVPI